MRGRAGGRPSDGLRICTCTVVVWSGSSGGADQPFGVLLRVAAAFSRRVHSGGGGRIDKI